MFTKKKTAGLAVTLAATMTLLAACDSGEVSNSGGITGSGGGGGINNSSATPIDAGANAGTNAGINAGAGTDANNSINTPDTTNVDATQSAPETAAALTAIDVSAAELVATVSKSGTSGSDTATDFNFPEISMQNEAMSMTIPEGALPEFAARRTLSAGPGQSIEFGDAVVLKYDMFSWTTGELAESSSQLEGPFAVKAGVSDNIPEFLAKSLLGRRLGETMQLVFPAGMKDLPSYMDQNDAYVLVVELL